ncbi:chemotaxis protein CheX [Sulfurimonas sp. SAG-AH-194-I05]|nr:chemotaxis protein CheX [Sulfurimonas sp. SAG-AH-194-I05]MDF1875870.1 chemotaxis protein CheX [Sulfurimonas sp. SAG-AH-194-I05]
MLTTILQASENFCIHQMCLSHVVSNTMPQKKSLIVYIDINTHTGQKHRVYIAADSNFIQKVAKLFLEEDESDEETLRDMALETANLIVGSAKVIAEEENSNAYTIDTPHFEKIDIFDFAYDQINVLQIEEDSLIIAIKEID